MGWRRRERELVSTVAAPPTAAELVADPSPDPGDTLTAVTAELAEAESGVEFVYRSLDRLRQRSGADDLVVIVDEPAFGRQVFRAGRTPIAQGWARELVRSGAAGVHADPGSPPVDPALSSSVTQLCSMALHLDVARHDSLHDGLTGLLNRRAFDEVLANACAQSERYGWTFALVLLDLDGFKEVNDQLGHATGDLTLQAVGLELRHRLRVGDAAARVGGDEFALVLPNVDIAAIAEMMERLERAVALAAPAARLTMTAGYAMAPAEGNRPVELYRIADGRLYEGKRR